MNSSNETGGQATNDHVVPRMYLKRFAIDRPGGPQLVAAQVNFPDRDFTTNTRNIGSEKSFYWGTGPNGIPSHDMEAFLTDIESEATTAFRRILDRGRHPTDDALPRAWPPTPETRAAVAWWLAAQLIRTAPQRERLWRLHGDDPLEPPRSLRRADLHHAYIVKAVAPLAMLLYARPWGIGFTNMCLLTSDAPVQVLNAKADDDPLATTTFWDIYVPLDPHRFLYLPGEMHADQSRLLHDHRINLPGGLAIALNNETIETAHRHIIWHPHHDPRSHINLQEALQMRQSRESGVGGIVLQYVAMPGNYGIERRWLEKHTWDDEGTHATDGVESASSTAGDESPDQDQEAIDRATEMMGKLDRARAEFEGRYK